LGYGIALRLAQEGASIVALLDMKKEELDEAASQLETELRMTLDGAPSSKRTFYGLVCDVTNLEQVTETFHHVATTLSPTKRIDILVQAAGVTGTTNILTHDPIQPANFDFVMDINIKGIFHGCHAVLPYMLKQNYGRIINIASIAGKEGNAGMLAYSTSKAAVIGLTKTVGKEYALDGITCNAIAPAVVWTKMVEMLPAAQVTYMTDKIPM
jgi:3-oxoacyl-[acyl-carrier protein] reductase